MIPTAHVLKRERGSVSLVAAALLLVTVVLALTVMLLLVPVMLPVAVSVAVIVCVPIVLRVATKLPAPLVSVLLEGRVAWPSVLVKWTVPP